ncbi:unnamed protein product [Hymenolepis diminuta]|uniref:Uncharacterized protein n=1 Tax=Hymenolepis diminuta TaxID=6216 RepID=A0A564Z239_HYMDI|nr:unnamed protein product [Hymenolepis diminuta]
MRDLAAETFVERWVATFGNACAPTYKLFKPSPSNLEYNPIVIPTNLKTCSHFFLRHDTVLRPIQPTYDGPFKVLQRGEKTFTILQNDKEHVVPMDRVISTYLDKLVTDNASPVFHPNPPVKETEKPISFTRSGRHVRFLYLYKV